MLKFNQSNQGSLDRVDHYSAKMFETAIRPQHPKDYASHHQDQTRYSSAGTRRATKLFKI